LASQLEIPVVPVGISATREWRLRSWDHFRIPKPFSRVEIVFGESLSVPADLAREEVLAFSPRIEQALRDVSVAAAKKTGKLWPD
jgi:lysophospholipid acyltransferase (LPLAT)-like uncharacterized protein